MIDTIISQKIMLKTETFGFILFNPWKTSTFKKQKKWMMIKKTDERFNISLNNAKIKKFHDDRTEKKSQENKKASKPE